MTTGAAFFGTTLLGPASSAEGDVSKSPAEPLQLNCLKRVATCNLPRFQSGNEPAGALLRSTVREGIGHHLSLDLPLQPIIANGRRRLHCRFYVAGFDELPLFLGVVRPHAGKAVRLQLDPYLQLISVDLVHAALRVLHPGQHAEQILNVVTDLVRNHVGLRKLTAFAVAAVEAPFEVLKECRVEIDLLIVWAVEWPHCGLGQSAGGSRGAGE